MTLSSLLRFLAATTWSSWWCCFITMVSTTTVQASIEKDMNVYPFGSNPNNGRRMYFPDGASVLRNLDKFSSLHIRFHNCAWSSNAAQFDDDGEYHDGEDAWYQGRIAGSSANAGFSLYGHLKSSLPRLGFGNCRKATYINSFFTNNGADVLVDALGLKVDNSYTYCHEYEYDGNDGNNYNNGGEDNKDNENNNNNQNALPQSATLGCMADGKFGTALFTDENCDGHYFWNTTTSDNTYASYNQKLGGVHCRKIWSGRASGGNGDDDGYASVAHQILLQSNVCDTQVHPQCPNPWRKKSRYEHKFKMAGASRTTVLDYRVRRPLVRLSHCILVVAAFLSLWAYRARNKKRLQEYGWVVCLQKDIPRFFKKRAKAVKRVMKGRKKRKGDSGLDKNHTFSEDTWEDPFYDNEDDDEEEERGRKHSRRRSNKARSFELT